jgi:hypothetical protein
MPCDGLLTMLASGGRLIRGGDVGYATRLGSKVQTVLGLSMTATSIGWVLLDGQGPDAPTLDHDAFDVQSSADTAGDASQLAAAARGAQAIATASGHKVVSVQVTWTEEVESAATALLKSLADLGFDNVHAISSSKAAQAWGIEIGRENEHTKTGLCILEPDAATIMIVPADAGSVRTAVIDTCTSETAEDVVESLRTVFRRDGWLPESLYLVGALADLDEVLGPIVDALPIPVSNSVDTQLALARGAALATVSQVNAGSSQAAEPPWLASHAKKLSISAAAVAVFGVALPLAASSALNVESASTQAANTAASGASVASASVHTVPAPVVSAPQALLVQPLAAEPPPVQPAPPETLALSAEPDATVAPEPVAAPAPQPTIPAAPPATISAAAPTASPPMALFAAPPTSPSVDPVVAQPAPIAPPFAAPLVAQPEPIAPPFGAPLVPQPAPIPASAAAPLPPQPADPPPPPDPIQAALGPLFSGSP